MIKLLVRLSQLHKPVRALIRKLNLGSFVDRMNIDAIPRTEYAYALYYSARQAQMLGIDRISVIEFGVAGGASLKLLEQYSIEIEKITNVKIDVYGFDTGEGMPEATDFRDLPYIWQKGFFKMNFDNLKKQLSKTELIIGDVKNTIGSFIEKHSPAPIGFVSIDVDYYSSATDCLRLFNNSSDSFLPRVYCYLDDTIGDDWELHNKYVGELLAVEEFNQNNPQKKIAQIHGLKYKRIIDSAWNQQMFVAHLFDHPDYDKYCNPKDNWQLEL